MPFTILADPHTQILAKASVGIFVIKRLSDFVVSSFPVLSRNAQ